MRKILTIFFILGAFSAYAQTTASPRYNVYFPANNSCSDKSQATVRAYLKNYSDEIVRDCNVVKHTVKNVFHILSVVACKATDSSGSYYRAEFKSGCDSEGLKGYLTNYKPYNTLDELLKEL